MGDVTARDRVWAVALHEARRSSWGVTVDKIIREMDDPPSRRTIQRTLRAMTDLGYLQHRTGQNRYRTGERLPR
jgi:DNA-binding IclR family transcriptional regulator